MSDFDQGTSPDTTATELLDALREQLREDDVEFAQLTEEEIAELDETPSMPPPKELVVGAEAEMVVDELLLEPSEVPTELRARVVAGVDQLMATRREQSGLLENLLSGARRKASMSVDDVATKVGVDAAELRGLETGEHELRAADALVVAKWIRLLASDEGDLVVALAALERSAHTTAHRSSELLAMGGHDDATLDSDEFVADVREHLQSLGEDP